MYKLCNNFVDDAFAFFIESPLKHRLMTLRDDAVFSVFSGQFYWYKVDRKRANEYGYVYEELEPKNDGGQLLQGAREEDKNDVAAAGQGGEGEAAKDKTTQKMKLQGKIIFVKNRQHLPFEKVIWMH